MDTLMQQFDRMFNVGQKTTAALIKAREDLADATVRESDWRGDECGYLAAQAKARTLRGLTPTVEQAEAWYHDNTNELREFRSQRNG
jgi:hypothetical protein